jgi:hypothetical protein
VSTTTPIIQRVPTAIMGAPIGGQLLFSQSQVGRYAVFSQTDTCVLLSLVKGSRVQSLQRSRKDIPASRAMRSSSDGQT